MSVQFSAYRPVIAFGNNENNFPHEEGHQSKETQTTEVVTDFTFLRNAMRLETSVPPDRYESYKGKDLSET